MKWLEFLTKIDRRIIYLVLALVVLMPLLFPSAQSVIPKKPVEKLFNAVDTIPEEKVLMMDCDYDPQTQPELEPMAIAILRHAFKRRIKVAVLSLYIQPLGLAKKALDDVTAEFNARAETYADSIIYGRDYVFLGWQPPPIIPILGMGLNIANVYKTDYYGNNTDTLPMMKHVRNYDDVGILVSVSSGNPPLWWIAYAQTRFGLHVSAGITAVSASDFYPYYQSGQFTGLMVGMKGAAEYEELVDTKLEIDGRRKASEAMGSLTAAHITIILFIIIGNVGYFLRRRK
ncbi:MAG: hypothetical protein JSW02_11230 [candidate division WOR-3 bacterium]|nr:MAG: hypothetical protein JSW02_11230 [candidate division WOR-3 bacterium]